MKFLSIFFSNKKALCGFIILLIFIIIAIFAPFISPYSPTSKSFLPLERPSREHILGTDAMGQDIFSQVVWGTRLSLSIGILTGAITTIIALVIGLIAGYFGGVIDNILMLITNTILVIPGLPLMIVIASYFPIRGTGIIILVISLTGWAWGARVLRSQVLSLKERDFVFSSKMLGENSFHIIFVDILPNMLGIIFANFFGATVSAVLSEAGLEFLGLGDVNAVSWGTILFWAQNNMALYLGAWQWIFVPGLLISLLGLSFALMNFGVDEIVNPKLRSGGENL
ncbi:MAG TPA: ABC transporter permease [Defluviitaleaceae bacterium]|jgi:peptide/nickel transport system permease protein|nr:ABC transporter permease [Defluviitaleaceae bacterium]